jgi:TRAP-type C4-dicarboxylate transport system permease small subunit
MNTVKRYLGILWMAIAVLAYIVLLKTAYHQISIKPTTDTIMQWSIFAIIFFPIAIGFVLFGWLALKGAYDKLPASSDEIED